MRPILFSLAAALLVALSACGGDAEPSDDGASQNSTATTAASGGGGGAATPSGSDSGGDGGTGNGGTSEADIEQFVADLEPPNSSGILSESTSDGITYISWETPDSLDDLRGFYEDVIADAGYTVSSQGGAGVSYEWIFGPAGDSDFRGILTVSPGNGGTIVAAQVGAGS